VFFKFFKTFTFSTNHCWYLSFYFSKLCIYSLKRSNK